MIGETVSDVLLHTQDMMLAAIEARWDDLANMQIIQDEMLKALFSVAEMVFLEKERKDFIEVQRLNQDILNAVEGCKADIAAELRAMRQGKAKAGAYQSA